jgi:ABC-2 type transport system ATP-binding protein
MHAIEVDHLTKRYRAALAVDAISFVVPRGETVGLLGGNGAGKTTTIAMLLGLLVPTHGRITVLGHDMGQDRFAATTWRKIATPPSPG